MPCSHFCTTETDLKENISKSLHTWSILGLRRHSSHQWSVAQRMKTFNLWSVLEIVMVLKLIQDITNTCHMSITVLFFWGLTGALKSSRRTLFFCNCLPALNRRREPQMVYWEGPQLFIFPLQMCTETHFKVHMAGMNTYLLNILQKQSFMDFPLSLKLASVVLTRTEDNEQRT